jgi:hypothetical protein
LLYHLLREIFALTNNYNIEDAVHAHKGSPVKYRPKALIRELFFNYCQLGGLINPRALLTHIGKYQARACAEAIQLRARGTYDRANGGGGDVWSKSAAKADRSAISQVIFTDPQIASVGLTSQKAKNFKLNA